MAEKKKMSVAEILAAARKMDSKTPAAAGTPAESGGTAPSEEPPHAEANAGEAAAQAGGSAAPQPAAPQPKAAAARASGERPSVKDILAMARAGAKPAAAAAPAAAKPAAEKPVSKPAAEKPAKPAPASKTAPASKPAAVGPKDTASILAAARKAVKPGPVSKSEAAQRLPHSPAPPAAARSPAAEKAKAVVPPMPTKPDYAKKKPAAEEEEDRRGFVGFMFGSLVGLGFTSLAVTGGLWSLGTARFMFPNILTEPPSQFKVGFPADFPPGSVADKFKAQFGVWIVNDEYNGQQQIYALRTVCTHLGCTPNWLEAEQKFKCPCHGSGFYKTGINFEGPAPRPLERYAIRIADDGQLEVDKSKLFQEEMGQWNDPACFVPV